MGKFYTDTLQPCPPVIGDYAELLGGDAGSDFPTPTEYTLNNLNRTDYDTTVYKVLLTAGKTYRFAVATSQTFLYFDEAHASLYIWKPSDWVTPLDLVTATIAEINAEDVEPYWCPYNDRLNIPIGPYYKGGRRYELVATETGYYVFLFKNWVNPD